MFVNFFVMVKRSREFVNTHILVHKHVKIDVAATPTHRHVKADVLTWSNETNCSANSTGRHLGSPHSMWQWPVRQQGSTQWHSVLDSGQWDTRDPLSTTQYVVAVSETDTRVHSVTLTIWWWSVRHNPLTATQYVIAVSELPGIHSVLHSIR